MPRLTEPLAESERGVLREADRQRMLDLDEDELIALHSRVRRARDKHVKLYRRQASARVAEVGSRGAARPQNVRNAQKAELFEDALSRVSRQLAIAARRSATELKAERLAAVRAARMSTPPAEGPVITVGETVPEPVPRKREPSPQMRKQWAATRAEGARKQARRDSRESSGGRSRTGS